MAKFDGIQSTGRNLNPVSNNTNNIDEQIDALNSSIPEQTSTKVEKEAAIRVKKKIIALMQEKLQEAHRNNNTGLASSISAQIKVIDGEIDTIKSELQAMSSVFDTNESDYAGTKSANVKNSVFV